MYLKYVPMNGKILALTCFILFVSLGIAGAFTLTTILDERRDLLTEQAMLMARTVSEIPTIQIATPPLSDANTDMQNTVEELRLINDAAYIVVMNMERVRLTHPAPQLIGTVSQSEDMDAAFAEHYYTTEAQGELGPTIRAFAPIVNPSNQQVGVVVVGYMMPSIWQLMQQFQEIIWVTIFISIAFSIGGATLLSRHMKQQMYGLEPHQIARLYTERTETFNAMHEGIIAIDTEKRITIFNPKAMEVLALHGDFIGQPIESVIADTRLPEILDFDAPVYNKELYIQNTPIISNRVPIRVDGKTIGAIAIFRDRTDVKALAEELTGVKAFVEALRVQTHEYKNKLHTIAGLLQLGKTTEALHYITEVKNAHDELTSLLQERIEYENIAGLLLSKVQVGREQGVDVILDPEIRLVSIPPTLDQHDLVLILGNLVENALEALQLKEGYKEIYISIENDEHILAIEVSDNGYGMSEEVQQNMLKRGFSTKAQETRGIGLYLVYQIIQKGGGELVVTSEYGQGTTMMITFEQ